MEEFKKNILKNLRLPPFLFLGYRGLKKGEKSISERPSEGSSISRSYSGKSSTNGRL